MLSGLAFLAAFVMFIASDITNYGFPKGKPVVLRRRAAILVSGVTGMTGAGMFFVFLQNVGVQSWWQIVPAFIVFMLVTGMVAALWNSWPKNSKEGPHDAS